MDPLSATAESLTLSLPRWPGAMKLDALRPVAIRACRLAASLCGAPEADLLVMLGDATWRLCVSADQLDSGVAPWREVERESLGPTRVRAKAPIRLANGFSPGELRVLDPEPRLEDERLIGRLRDLAAFVADECDRLVDDQSRMVRELFEQAPGFMAMLVGPDHVFDGINQAWVALAGPRPILGLSARVAMPELIDQGFIAILDEVATSGRSRVGQGVPIELERRPGERELLYVDVVLQPIFDPEGKVSSIFLQGTDVTAEKRSDEALRASQAKLEAALEANEAIFDHSYDVICTIDAAGRFTRVSHHAAEVWGYPPDYFVGRQCLEFAHPDDVETTRAILAEIRQGKPTSSFRHRSIRKDGSIVPLMWSAAWSERHQAFFAIGRDMSESVRAEEKLRRAEKMEAIGRLTGGVAHDFNNLLTIIVGSSEALADMLPAGSDAQGLAQLTLDAGKRGADLVSHLLAFSRGKALDPQPIDTGQLLASLEPLIRRAVGVNIEVQVAADTRPTCRADRSQLESALLNLAINSRDAMPAGGRLTIRACGVVLSEANVKGSAMSPGRYVRLEVNDTGHGMDAKILERAIEPFFTTKDVGKGSGLGLATVYGFVKQSGGALRLRSRPGHGTKVEMFLPAVSRADTAAFAGS